MGEPVIIGNFGYASKVAVDCFPSILVKDQFRGKFPQLLEHGIDCGRKQTLDPIREKSVASRGVNKAILVGNVGNDPEVRYMPNGNAVANVSIATSDQWKDKNTGEQQERTEWHRVVFFNRLAEIVEQYVKKGSKLYIEGRLQTRSWEQDVVKRYTTEIVANEMQMLDSRGGGGDSDFGQSSAPPRSQSGGGGGQQGGGGQSGSGGQQGGGFDNFDDDIPF